MRSQTFPNPVHGFFKFMSTDHCSLIAGLAMTDGKVNSFA